MHIILGVLGLLVGAWFLLNRVRTGATVVHEVADMASDVIGAARQWNFRRRANIHPVDAIEDGRVAVAAIGYGYLALGGLLTTAQTDRLNVALQSRLRLTEPEAAELVILARWLVEQCGTPAAAVARLAKRLARLGDAAASEAALDVLGDLDRGDRAGVTEAQREARGDVTARLTPKA